MAKKISDLPVASAAFTVDEDECNQSGVSRRVSNVQRIALYKANLYDQDLDTTDDVSFNNIDSTGIIKTDTVDENVLNAGVTIDGALIKDGLVDGVDVSALKTDVDGFPDELKNLTTAEITQLENIGANTISNTQWGYVGLANQRVRMTDDVSFSSVTLATTGGTPTALDYYEDFSDIFTFDFSGIVWTALQTITIRFIRIGKFVNMQFEGNLLNTTQAAPGSDIVLWAGSLVPTRFRPAFNITQCCRNFIGGISPNNEAANVFIQTTGGITVRQNQMAPNWPASQTNTGIAGASFNWVVT